MVKLIRHDAAPPLGDLRRLGKGDIIWVTDKARDRKDWPRIVSAVADAVSNGADVRRLA